MLKKIYSSTDLFDSVTFKEGINLIVGKYTGKEGINGIGKSSLIRLIDYCLLSNSAAKTFNQKKFDFLRSENHLVSLDFEIRKEKFSICRDFNPDSDITFIDSSGKSNYSKNEIRSVLTNKFFPVESDEFYIEGDKFRTLMRFFIKDDLNNIRRANPLDFLEYSANRVELAILNFFMYGIKNTDIYTYKEDIFEYKESGKLAKAIEKRVLNDLEKDISELKTEKLKVEKEVERLGQSLKNYKFLENYKQVEDDITSLTLKIREKLREHSKIIKKIEKLKQSYKRDIDIDTRKLEHLYNESLESFGTIVVKKLNEVIQFKNKVLENREKYVSKRIKILENEVYSLENSIREFEILRSEKYRTLNEKGALDSIKNSYESFIEKKSDVDQYSGYISQHDKYLTKQSLEKIKIQQDKNKIVEAVNSYEEKIDDLRVLFYEILENAIFLNEEFENSYFDIKLKSGADIRSLPFQIEVEIPKEEALGHSRHKIVAYDLMVFLNTLRSKRLMPDFLVHDGVFHGIFNGTIINTLNYMDRELANFRDAQYILSFNEDEIILDEKNKYGEFNFNVKDKIIVVYYDDPSKMIFRKNID